MAGCKEASEPEPVVKKTLIAYPVSITSANPEGTNEIFHYDHKKRLVMREYFTRLDTTHYFELIENEDMYISRIDRKYHSPADTITTSVSFNYYHFENQPMRRNEWVSTLKEAPLAYELYTYTPNGEMLEQEFHSTHHLLETHKFVNEKHIMIQANIYDAIGMKTTEIDLAYDNKKHPHEINANYRAILLTLGYPHSNNITKLTTKDAAGRVLKDKSYVNEYTYDEHNYPIQVKRVYQNGTSNTYTYTYKWE